MAVQLTYESDRASLWRGDALQVIAQLDPACVDSVITDPPYSSGGMFRGDRSQTAVSKYVTGQNMRSYQYWCALWLAECLRITRPGGVCLMFTDWRQLPATTDALQAGGWVWRGIVPWHKPGARPNAGRFTAACEYVCWGSNGSMGLDLSDPCLRTALQEATEREEQGALL